MMPGMYVAEINKLLEENEGLREKNIGLRLEKIVQGVESALVISKLLGAVDELRQNNAETLKECLKANEEMTQDHNKMKKAIEGLLQFMEVHVINAREYPIYKKTLEIIS